MKFDAGIDYELFLDCVHCGLCTSACPTYVELGDENDSPRGRIYLMRGVTDGRIPLDDKVKGHLDLCLDCRACESACPSGVQYGKLIEPFRLEMARSGVSKEQLGWFKKLLLFGLTPYARAHALGAQAGQVYAVDRSGFAFYEDGLIQDLAAHVAGVARDGAAAAQALHTSGDFARGRTPARPCGTVHRLCCRRLFPRNELCDCEGAAKEWLRSLDSARPGLLRRLALSCRSSGAGPAVRGATARFSSRTRSMQSSSMPRAVERCSRNTIIS